MPKVTYYAADGGLFPDATAHEDELLDRTAEPRRDDSRPSCQPTLTDQVGDLVIHVQGART